MMMRHFKLALFAIILILGCVFAQFEANEETALQQQDETFLENEIAEFVENEIAEFAEHEEMEAREWNDDDDDQDENVNVRRSPCAPPPKSSSTGRPSTTGRPSSTTGRPTEAPTRRPTSRPTQAPTRRPTSRPTEEPTRRPTSRPTEAPTRRPTSAPTTRPTPAPTRPSTSGSSSGGNVGLCDLVPTSQEPLKLLVPLYVYPGSAWDQVAAGASKVPTIAIINPNSGPSSGPDSSYVSYMTKLRNANVEMIGYVYTSYGSRSIADVKKDIDTYASKFSGLTGIFFDEVSDSASQISYYTQAYNYVMQKGYKHSILNPGVQPAQGYLDISTSIVIFEEAGSKFSSRSFANWVTCAPNSSQKSGYKYKFAGIAHSASSSTASSVISSMQSKGLGLVYVTDGAAGCCTYNELVSYYSSEASTVQSANNRG